MIQKIELLFDECRAVQNRLEDAKTVPQDNVKSFTRLMLQGRVSAALRFIGSQESSLLTVSETVLQIIIIKSRLYKSTASFSMQDATLNNLLLIDYILKINQSL